MGNNIIWTINFNHRMTATLDHLQTWFVSDIYIYIYICSGSRSRKQRLTAVETRCADHVTPLYPKKLALTSPTGGGRSVGIVRVRTKATEF